MGPGTRDQRFSSPISPTDGATTTEALGRSVWQKFGLLWYGVAIIRATGHEFKTCDEHASDCI